MNQCAVYGCGQAVKARHLCRQHYWSWMTGFFTDEAETNAGQLNHALKPTPLVCVCERPQPDGLGMCVRCGRLVVTFAHACQDRYMAQYSEEWQRAVELGMTPKEST